MIQLAALFLAAATSQTADTIFTAGLDEPYVCPASITTGNDTRTLRHTSDIIYLPNTGHVRRNVNITDFNNIWGHIDELDGITLWPGIPGASPTIKTIGKTEYVGAKFHVPAFTPPTVSGSFKHVMYSGGPRLDFSISRFCGDFHPEEDGCSVTGAAADDNAMVHWRVSAGDHWHCGLQPDTDYYVNIRFTDRATTGPDCFGSTCYSTIQQYVGLGL
jgi:hypothetical protein